MFFSHLIYESEKKKCVLVFEIKRISCCYQLVVWFCIPLLYCVIASCALFWICKFYRSRSIEVNLRCFKKFESCFKRSSLIYFVGLRKRNRVLDFCIIRFGVLFVALKVLLYFAFGSWCIHWKRNEKAYSLGTFFESSHSTSQS